MPGGARKSVEALGDLLCGPPGERAGRAGDSARRESLLFATWSCLSGSRGLGRRQWPARLPSIHWTAWRTSQGVDCLAMLGNAWQDEVEEAAWCYEIGSAPICRSQRSCHHRHQEDQQVSRPLSMCFFSPRVAEAPGQPPGGMRPAPSGLSAELGELCGVRS